MTHKLLVINHSEGEQLRVRIHSHHDSVAQLLECGLCRRLLAAGFRIDLKQDPAPAGDRIRGEFRISD